MAFRLETSIKSLIKIADAFINKVKYFYIMRRDVMKRTTKANLLMLGYNNTFRVLYIIT